MPPVAGSWTGTTTELGGLVGLDSTPRDCVARSSATPGLRLDDSKASTARSRRRRSSRRRCFPLGRPGDLLVLGAAARCAATRSVRSPRRRDRRPLGPSWRPGRPARQAGCRRPCMKGGCDSDRAESTGESPYLLRSGESRQRDHYRRSSRDRTPLLESAESGAVNEPKHGDDQQLDDREQAPHPSEHRARRPCTHECLVSVVVRGQSRAKSATADDRPLGAIPQLHVAARCGPGRPRARDGTISKRCQPWAIPYGPSCLSRRRVLRQRRERSRR